MDVSQAAFTTSLRTTQAAQPLAHPPSTGGLQPLPQPRLSRSAKLPVLCYQSRLRLFKTTGFQMGILNALLLAAEYTTIMDKDSV